MLIGSTVIYIVFSSGIIATILLHPLEYHYPYLKNPQEYPQSKAIVVLTAYAAKDYDMPLSSRTNSASLYRVVEAVRIYKQCQNCHIYISGPQESAEVIQELFIQLDIPHSSISLDTVSAHTYHSAINMKKILKNKPFFLVSSAGHMPRAMGVFEKQHMQPIPAPTDHRMPKDVMDAPIEPKSHHLYFSDLAVTEYAALAWYWLVNRI